MRWRGVAPRTVAGVLGMLLIAGLYMGNALATQGGGHPSPAWLVILLLPGALAAHISWQRGQSKAIAEGVRAGLLMAHFAALLQAAVLVIAVLTTDWTRYAGQVGLEIASAVRDAAIPAAAVAALAIVGITYAGCILAGWLGASVHVLLRSTMERKR